MPNQVPTLSTFQHFSQRHPAFSEASLRWLRFNQESNGFSSVFVEVGTKRVLIDESEFFRVIEEQNRRSQCEVA